MFSTKRVQQSLTHVATLPSLNQSTQVHSSSEDVPSTLPFKRPPDNSGCRILKIDSAYVYVSLTCQLIFQFIKNDCAQ